MKLELLLPSTTLKAASMKTKTIVGSYAPIKLPFVPKSIGDGRGMEKPVLTQAQVPITISILDFQTK